MELIERNTGGERWLHTGGVQCPACEELCGDCSAQTGERQVTSDLDLELDKSMWKCFRTFMRHGSLWETALERPRRMQVICSLVSSRSSEQGTSILDNSDTEVVKLNSVQRSHSAAIPQLSSLRLVEKLFNITKSCSTCCLHQRDKNLQFYKYQSSLPILILSPPEKSGTQWRCENVMQEPQIVNYKMSNAGER